jgi:hypothetical protein
MADRPDVDDRDFRRALDLWLRTTDRAARRLDDNPDAPLPPDEVYALEAVVRADGARPSDFAAESGSADVRRYRIVEATPSEVNGTKFAQLDAAVLRIEPPPDGPQDVPDALTVSADPDGPLGHLASYASSATRPSRCTSPAPSRVSTGPGSPEPCSETCTGSNGSHPA